MYNLDSNSSTNDTLYEVTVGYPVLVLEFAKLWYGIVFAVGLFGNLLVIYVVLRFSSMRTVTNCYILNLAVADVMFLIGLPFLIITVIKKSWTFGRLICKFYMVNASINQFTSSLLLVAMSADCYVAVCHPVFSRKYRTTFIAICVCLIALALSLISMRPIYWYANTLELPNIISCNIFWPESVEMSGEKAFTLYTFTRGFLIPCVIILLFYLLVFCTSMLKRVRVITGSEQKKRLPKKVSCITLVYLICWSLYWICQVYVTFLPPAPHRHSERGLTLLLLTGCLTYANSAVNPILCAILSKSFKKSFAKTFCCSSGNSVNARSHVENRDTQELSNFLVEERNIEQHANQ